MAGKRKKHEDHEEHENHERWLITYADMITLLMVLFIVLYSMGQVDLDKYKRLKAGLSSGFGASSDVAVLSGGSSLQTGAGALTEGMPAGTGTGTGPGDAAAALAAQQARQAAVQAEMATLRGAEAKLAGDLKRAGLAGAVTFRLESRGLVVSIASDKVLFDPGSAVIRREGGLVIDKLAQAIKTLPNPIMVEGHTDNQPISGRYPSNWELSTARATSVLRELVVGHGFSPARLSAAGYADQRPAADNATPGGRATNRRVEIVIQSTVAAAATGNRAAIDRTAAIEKAAVKSTDGPIGAAISPEEAASARSATDVGSATKTTTKTATAATAH